jgi:hypothetical protein
VIVTLITSRHVTSCTSLVRFGYATSVTVPDEIEVESLRLNRRYLEEVVERFVLCPWARSARNEGHVGECVLQQELPGDFAPSLMTIDALSERTELEVALLIYPRLHLSRLDFEHFARGLRALDADRYEPGEAPFAMAAFHPDAAPQLDDPERLIPFLRRSPYPTLQLVRTTSLERVRGDEAEGTAFLDLDLLGVTGLSGPTAPTLRERIARRNLETVRSEGVESVERVLEDIFRDRDRTDERLQGKKRA